MNTPLEKIRYFSDRIAAKLDGCAAEGRLTHAAAESILLLAECLVSVLRAHFYCQRAMCRRRYDQ